MYSTTERAVAQPVCETLRAETEGNGCLRGARQLVEAVATEALTTASTARTAAMPEVTIALRGTKRIIDEKTTSVGDVERRTSSIRP
jgi:hypothetical protein